MLTNAMPAVMRALQGSLPPAAIKQLTQALGNCNQQLTHRGDITVRPDAWSYANNNNGTYSDYPPSRDDYNRLVNNNGYDEYADVNNPYYNNANYNTNIDYGDTIIVQGGPPGAPGRDGQAGSDGQAAQDGSVGTTTPGQAPPVPPGAEEEAGPPGNPIAAGGNGRDGRDGAAGAAGAPGAAGQAGRDGGVGIGLLGALRRQPGVSTVRTTDVTVSFVKRKTIQVVTSVDFETCSKTEEQVDVIAELTPRFVVKEVREIPAIYYAP
jgi:hypothetical protein